MLQKSVSRVMTEKASFYLPFLLIALCNQTGGFKFEVRILRKSCFKDKEKNMTFSKIVKFKDKSGKWHSYIATYINGEMLPSDWDNIQKIINK